MKEFPKISDAEWKVMKVLWGNSPKASTSTEIIEALKVDNAWSPKTIHTLISRLVKKEALGVKKDISQNLYYPLVEEAECKMVESKSFLHKVYDGSFYMLLANFIKDEKLSQEEIKELRRMLDNQEE